MLKPLRMRPALLLAGAAAALIGIAALTVIGVAGTVQERVARQQIDNRAALVRAAAAGQLHRYVDTLSLVAAGVAAARPLTAGAFTRITAPLRDMGLSGVPAVAFVVPARTDQVAATQERWRSRGSSGLTLAPDLRVEDHLFAVLGETVDGSETRMTGSDSTRAPVAAAAMRQARATSHITVSDPYQLLRDRVLQPAQRQLSFVIAAPVLSDAGRPGGQSFQGWVVISLRGQDFISAVLHEFAQNLVDVTLLVRTADLRTVPVASLRAAGSERRDLHRTLDVTVAQAHWTIQIDAVAARLPGVHSALPATTGVVVVLIALLIAVLITGRARADQRVRVATAELIRSAAHLHTELDARNAAEALLRTAHDDLESERNRLTQILDALEVSVITCDRDGVITHLNRAARVRLGAVAGPLTIAEHGEHLGLSSLDGTALPEAELPLRRSLSGEIVDGLEVTTAKRQGDRQILRMHSRPLHDPGGGIVGAVASSYDITALREHQAELTAFAGVVAHDLKAPLTAVKGFTHLAVAALAAGAPRGTPSDHLRQVLDAVQRMDRLIEDLLRYAAARDAHLDVADIDLRALVDRAVADRMTEHAANPGAPVPQVYVGPLPTIRADATMMRQLLDNLIGNSFKYTRPGQPAKVDITAETVGTGELRLTVADRGIGIPHDQHLAIFACFYRADRGDHYDGTGLGLSVCQRIANRHGGVITAADNPGGGTRITVTLPAAVPGPSRPADPAVPVRVIASSVGGQDTMANAPIGLVTMTSQEHSAPASRMPHPTVSLLVAALGLGLNLRASILLGPHLHDRFGVRPGTYAVLVALPLLMAALVRLPVGVLTDRFGARVMFPAVSVAAAASVMAMGSADSLPAVVVAGAAAGLAGAAYVVGAALVSRASPYGRRGWALGVFGLGVAIAGVLSALSRWLDLEGRQAALVLGGLLIAFAVLAAATLRDPVGAHRGESMAAKCAELIRIASSTSLSPLYALALGGIMSTAVYLPVYLGNAFGFEWFHALTITGTVVVLAAVGRLFGGCWADRWPTARLLMVCYGVAAVLCVVNALTPRTSWVVTPVIAAMAIADGIASGVLLALIGKAAPADQVGAVMGVAGAAAALGALLPLVLLAGVDTMNHSYSVAWALLAAMLLAAALYVRTHGMFIGLGLAVRFEVEPGPTAMTVAVVGESDTRLDGPAVVARLAELATSDELVVYGSDERAPSGTAAAAFAAGLRSRLPRHRVVVVGVAQGAQDARTLGRDALLLSEHLDAGALAVAVAPTAHLHSVAADLALYLQADRVLTLSYSLADGAELHPA